jgi:hypothetical protein
MTAGSALLIVMQSAESVAKNNTIPADPKSKKRKLNSLQRALHKDLVAHEGALEAVTGTGDEPQKAWDNTFRFEV